MEQKTEKFHPPAPLQNEYFDSEQRLEMKMNGANSFNNSANNKETITYFKDKNHKSKKQ